MTNRLSGPLYFVGRGLQLFGLLLVTRAVFMSSGTELRKMLALTITGAAVFVVGWVLARKDPGAG